MVRIIQLTFVGIHLLYTTSFLKNSYLLSFICRDIAEGGYNYSEVDSLANSKEVLMKLADCSPCKNVHKVQAPTLLLLGEKDLRVPPSQGLSYYHLLKKHGVTAR